MGSFADWFTDLRAPGIADSPLKNVSRRESDTGFQEINKEYWGTASGVMTKQKGMKV